jgi:hypothetical protein
MNGSWIMPLRRAGYFLALLPGCSSAAPSFPHANACAPPPHRPADFPSASADRERRGTALLKGRAADDPGFRRAFGTFGKGSTWWAACGRSRIAAPCPRRVGHG